MLRKDVLFSTIKTAATTTPAVRLTMAKHFNYRFSFQRPSLKEPQNEWSPKRPNESGSYPFNTTAVTQNNKRSSNYLNVLTLKSVTVISFPTDSFAQNSQ